MGTCIDYAFRFGGLNQAKVNLALQYIRDVQKENAEFSGNGVCDFSGDPRDDEAFKLWSCYTKAGDETPLLLRLKLIDLTKGGDFTFWYYWDCTDGCNESSVESHQNGECIADFLWEPGILGFEASIAAATLDVRSDAGAVLQLVDALLSERQCGCEPQCGWDEDDVSTLENAHAAGVALARAFKHWPNLLRDETLRGTFADVTQALLSVREGGGEYLASDENFENEQAELHALQATLEAELLKQVTQTPSIGNPQHINGKRL